MKISFFYQGKKKQTIPKSMPSSFQRICRLVDKETGLLKGMVNMIFSDDILLRKLNNSYRGKDRSTDVLTFTYETSSESHQTLLGEIIFSVPQAARQAKTFARSLEQELNTLCIHGLLHLRGYDHEEDRDFRVMKLLEDKIMKMFLGSRKK